MLSWYMITQNELFIKYGNFTQHELSYEFVNACKYGDLTSVKYLLTSPELKKHADIHAEYDDGFKTSAMNGKVDIVKHLLTNIGENDPKNLNMQNNS